MPWKDRTVKELREEFAEAAVSCSNFSALCREYDITRRTGYKHFTVRCVSADGKTFTSSYDNTGKSITYLAAPTLTSVTKSGSSGVIVQWNAVPGAVNYRVFYKTGSGSWVSAGNSTSPIFIVDNLKAGTTYSLTVRCLSADGKSYTSAYDTTGLSITR